MDSMFRFLTIILVLSTVARLANAQQPQYVHASDLTADKLVDNCKHLNDEGDYYQNPNAMVCIYYVMGFMDGYAADGNDGWCSPDGVTYGQMGKVIARYGEVHPEELWKPAFLFAKEALTGAYPCKAH
jgi:hypothetical protein